MGREVRRVPKDWQHPRLNGRFVPLHDDYTARRADYERDREMWERGEPPQYATAETLQRCSFVEWAGLPPDPADYMPDWPADERTHWQMYEDTSEGTPISPVMDSPQKLARWLADTNASAFADEGATYDQWLSMINAGSSLGSMYLVQQSDGRSIMMSGVAAVSAFKGAK